MEIVEDTVYLTDSELKRLNQVIQKMIAEMKLYREFNWKSLKSIAQKYDEYNIRIPKPKAVVVPMKKQEVIGMAMQYFQSLGNDIYHQIVQAVMQQKKNVIVEVYDKHEIHDYTEMNEFDMPRYDDIPNVKRIKGKPQSTVYVPLHSDYSRVEKNAIGAEATLSDLYAFVHEISHLLDYNPNITENKTRKLVAESTAIAFEMGLSEFLLEKERFPREAIIYEYNTRANHLFNCLELFYMFLELIDSKNLVEEITKESLVQLQDKLQYKAKYTKYLFHRILKERFSLLTLGNYGIAAMLSPTISQKLRDPKKRGKILEYLEYVKSDQLDKFFDPLELGEQDIDYDTMFQNMQMQLDKINGREPYKREI